VSARLVDKNILRCKFIFRYIVALRDVLSNVSQMEKVYGVLHEVPVTIAEEYKLRDLINHIEK